MKYTPQSNRSLVAAKDIKENQVIANIPYSKLLKNTDLKNYPIYGKMEKLGMFKSPQEGGLMNPVDIQLALVLLYEI